MLLRSSSTPILRSLLSLTESPNNHHLLEKTSSLSSSSFPHHPKASVSCVLYPLSDSSPAHDPSVLGFRRARSDGNLHSLLSSDHKNNPALDTTPSFSMYSSREFADDDDEDDTEEGEDQFDEEANDFIGRGISGGFSLVGQDQNLNLTEKSSDDANPTGAFPLFLARGLGIDRLGSGLLNAGGGGSDGGGGGGGVRNGNGGERSDIEMYYMRMVEENPSNALFLSNYAQFLYQNKGDAQRAEEYYSRAILADPGDGEILSQYAKLVWELHHDKERASSYFEQAVQATPNDSHVLGAHARFLWETEDEDGDGDGNGAGEDDRSQDFFGAQVQPEPALRIVMPGADFQMRPIFS